MAYYPTERITIAQAVPLTNSAVNRFSNIFPLDGTGWTKLLLTFHAAVDWTNATLIDDHAVMRWIKGINLRTSRGEVIVDNVPGKAMWFFDSYHAGTTPSQERVLGADGTYEATLEIPFCFDFLNRPEDTIFNSGRYSNLQLDITTGDVLDFLNDNVGETLAVTMDIEVERTLSALSPDGKSQSYALPYFKTYGPFVNSAQNFFDLESSLDLGLFGFALFIAATGAANPFDGAATQGAGVDRLTSLTMRDSVRTWVDNALPWALKHELNAKIPFDATNIYIATPAITEQITYPFLGWYAHSFVQFGSINEHYPTGKKSLIRVTWTDGTNTDIGNLLVWGMRALR
jgi:hypothetical protein